MPLILELIESYPERGACQIGLTYRQRLKLRKDFVTELRQVYFELQEFLREVINTTNVSLPEDQREDLFAYTCERKRVVRAWQTLAKENLDVIKKALGSSETELEIVVNDVLGLVQVMFEDRMDRELQSLKIVVELDRNAAMSSLRTKLSSEFKFQGSSTIREEGLERLKQNRSRIKSLNNNLDEPTEELPPSGLSLKVKEPWPSSIETTRRYSHILHNTLTQLWDCPCHTFVAAMLRIKRRQNSATNDTEIPPLSVIFTFQHIQTARKDHYQETDIYVYKVPDVWTNRLLGH